MSRLPRQREEPDSGESKYRPTWLREKPEPRWRNYIGRIVLLMVAIGLIAGAWKIWSFGGDPNLTQVQRDADRVVTTTEHERTRKTRWVLYSTAIASAGAGVLCVLIAVNPRRDRPADAGDGDS